MMNIWKPRDLLRGFSLKNLGKMWHITKNIKKNNHGETKLEVLLACYLVSSISKKRFKSRTGYAVAQFILCTSPGAFHHQYFVPYRSSVYLHIIPLLCDIF